MFKTLKDLDVSGKTVLVRVDFNVPLKDGAITDDNRIAAALPTIETLIERAAKVILMSHLGRPKGQPNSKESLAPVAERLREMLPGRRVTMAPDCVGAEVARLASELQPGEILVLENLRFHAEEEKNDQHFAQKLADLADLYINDAFGAAHRAHASTHAVAKLLPAAAGLLMEKELVELGRLMHDPKRPFVAILGGAKVSDKIGVLKNLAKLADIILIGGGMAFTFLKIKGNDIGKSLCEKDLAACEELWVDANSQRAAIYLPSDVAVASEIKEVEERQEVKVDQIPDDMMGLDIGAETIAQFEALLQTAGTVFWNGPMGVFEVPPYNQGTLKVAQAIARSSAISCVGGGDSAAAVRQMNLDEHITHVSTGGGASLEFLEGQELPGVAVLEASAQATA
jgi:phosphoglycerate kinase